MPAILFVMKYPTFRHENLKLKFDGQMAAARALGYDAYCIGWDKHGMTLLGKGVSEPIRTNALASMPGYDHTRIFSDLMAAAREVLQHKHIDILYLRYMPTFGGAVKTIRRLKAQGGKLVIEFPTYPNDKENSRFFIRRQVFRYTDSVLRKINPMVDLYTAIGATVDGEIDGRPAMNIVNGVDVEALPLHAPNPDAPIKLLALASMCGWHGYDRILRSLAAYKGDADVRIELVGDDGDGSLAAWRALCDELGLSDRVTFRGAMHGDELNALIKTCDVGVGNLGMFRYGIMRAATLKTREYMARGLPFINAVDDYALSGDLDFVLSVPNDDTPISMDEVVSFAQRMKRDAGAPARMREYAALHMSWRSVMSGVFDRLASL